MQILKKVLITASLTMLILLAFSAGYIWGYKNGKNDIIQRIHKNVPGFEEKLKAPETNDDPVI
ncbi:MAG: hypothetical protein ABJH05_17625 [Fulvivirga sp.]